MPPLPPEESHFLLCLCLAFLPSSIFLPSCSTLIFRLVRHFLFQILRLTGPFSQRSLINRGAFISSTKNQRIFLFKHDGTTYVGNYHFVRKHENHRVYTLFREKFHYSFFSPFSFPGTTNATRMNLTVTTFFYPTYANITNKGCFLIKSEHVEVNITWPVYPIHYFPCPLFICNICNNPIFTTAKAY